jgi:hypothetical protein
LAARDKRQPEEQTADFAAEAVQRHELPREIGIRHRLVDAERQPSDFNAGSISTSRRAHSAPYPSFPLD